MRVYIWSVKDQEPHIQVEQMSELRHSILKLLSHHGQDIRASIAWLMQYRINTSIHPEKWDYAKQQGTKPANANRCTTAPHSVKHYWVLSEEALLYLTAFVKHWPAQEVIKITSINVTFTDFFEINNNLL